jgi:hypothetical protein
MSSITSSHVDIQTSPQSVPSTPSWLGEVAVVAHYLIYQGLLEKIVREVRFSRKRFGTYETIDFLCVLIGYTRSLEATLKEFYERLQPFATPFMALFGRSELPSRSALSRYLSAIDQSPVEALRTLFQKDLVARPFTEAGKSTGGLWDRCGEQWLVFDVDGTRQVARQRALPSTPDLPPAHRRMTEVCAPGYDFAQTGRGCSHTHYASASAYPSVDGNLRQSWQRGLPRRSPACGNRHYWIRHQSTNPQGQGHPATLRPIWRLRCSDRSGQARTSLCHAWKGLWTAEST